MLGMTGTRRWVYPLAVRGTFQSLRTWTFALLHVILFATPWIPVGGHPALRIDLPARRVYLLGHIFTAADTIFVLLLLLFLAFALFFFTSLFGRIWCGYACPQTVLLETWIRPVEEWIEGRAPERQRRDAGPWSLDTAWRKAAKWTFFALASLLVAASFVSYFSGARAWWAGEAGRTAYAVTGIFTLVMFLDFAWFREQFCTYVCPYARFQSVLSDSETLTVTYDPTRGEPRQKRRAAGLAGQCIDCSMCVAVCPTGIDIRHGFQLECIACARCVDACTHIMAQFGQRSLVVYDTLAAIEGRTVRRVRPRTIAYGGLLAGIAAAAVVLAVGHSPIEAHVSRLPGSLYTVDGDGWIRNTYMLRVTNNDAAADAVPFHVEVQGLPEAQVVVQEDLALASTETRTLPVVVRVPPDDDLPRTVPIRVCVSSPASAVVLDATFKSPGEELDSARAE